MHLTATATGLFRQLRDALHGITAEQYTTKNSLLSNASVGQHVRHIVELFQQMVTGYGTGEINYENRQRNFLIETDISFALAQLDAVAAALSLPNKNLQLTAGYDIDATTSITVATNYYREIIYNVEHTIHHMALIRIALEWGFNITLPADFGVAPSTLKYRKACAQ